MPDVAGAVAGMTPDNGIRVGTVKQVVPLVIDFNGGEVNGAGSLALVNVGDTVACMRQAQTWLVLGVVSPAAAQWGVMAGVRGSFTISIAQNTTQSNTTLTNLYSLPRAPAGVFLNFNGRPGGTANWWIGATGITATGFIAVAYGPTMSITGGVSGVRIDYLAIL